MNKRKMKMAKAVVEYIQQLAGRDKLTVTFYLNDFMRFVSATEKEGYEYLNVIVSCLEWLTEMHIVTNNLIKNNVSIYNAIEYVEIDDGNRINVKFNKITKDFRKEHKNWLIDHLNKGWMEHDK